VQHPIQVVLASQSPRRLSLLTAMGLPLIVMPSSLYETPRRGEAPADLARRLAQEKARSVSAQAPDAVIIAADTLVVLDGRVLGKPQSAEDAMAMLMRLRGRRHEVYSGLALVSPDTGEESLESVCTPVLMRNYSELEMRAYVNSGDPMDKAGAYAIQSEVFDPVLRVEGCYANVMGMPLCHLYRALAGWGLAPPRHPLERCPWPVQYGGCSWAGDILRHQ